MMGMEMGLPSRQEVKVQHVRTEAELLALQKPWADLMADAPDASLFLTWEWTNAWWRHYGVEQGLWLLAAWDGAGRLAGVAPWMLARPSGGASGTRRMAFIFYRPPSRLDVVARPDRKEEVCAAFLTHLAAHGAEWDILELMGLVQGSLLKPSLNAMGGHHLERLRVINPFITLPDEWATYFGTLSKERRKSLRNARNRLEQEHPGQACYHRVTEPAELPAALDTLVTLNRARWHSQGKTSVFDASEFRAFHCEMAAIALHRGWLRFYQLTVGEQIVATTYCFRYGDVFYAYQSGFDLEWARYSPGRLIIAHAIREAIREGAREFDMLRGTEKHKLSWTSEARTDSHLLVSNNWRGHRYLMVAWLFDIAVSGGRKVLPQRVRDRLGHLVVGKPPRIP